MKKNNAAFSMIRPVPGETLSAKLPPYSAHVSDEIVMLDDQRMLAIIAIPGCPFEAEADSALEAAFRNMRQMLINHGLSTSNRLGIWTHISRQKTRIEYNYQFPDTFSRTFAEKYIASFNGQNFYRNTYYLTLVLKTAADDSLRDNIRFMHDMLRGTREMLRAFTPDVLGVYRDGNGTLRSATLETLAWLTEHREVEIPLTDSRGQQAIARVDPIFGYDTVEIRPRGGTPVFATGWMIDGFPKTVKPGCLNFLLEASCEFVFTQALFYHSRQKSLKAVDGQRKFLREDKTTGEADMAEIKLAREALGRGETLFGLYYSALFVFGETVREARERGGELAAQFSTGESAFQMIQATTELPTLYLSQLPGSTEHPLSSMRNTSVLAAMFSGHNYSSGKEKGNPPGDGTALMPMKTTANGLYHYNTHYSELHRNVTGKPISGHGLFLGTTGAGKTTLQSALATFMRRWNPMMFTIDYNRSAELPMRAFGGEYFTIQEGTFTGLQPFQVEPEGEAARNAHLQALYRWVGSLLADQGQPVRREWVKDIKAMVDTVMLLDIKDRRVSSLLHTAPLGSEIRARLEPWCEEADGPYAWAVDSPVNTFDPSKHSRVGFDTTTLMDIQSGYVHPACEPVLGVLFMYKNLMQRKGRMMLTTVEEFWVPCNYPTTAAQVKSILKAGRIKGEICWLVSQSPKDAIKCAIFEAIVEQTQTKTLLPNPDATYEGNYDLLGLTHKEFTRLKELDKESRTFLIKQSGSSVFAKMDLYGFDNHLPILSADTADIMLANDIIANMGKDPDIWIPEYLKQRIINKEKGA